MPVRGWLAAAALAASALLAGPLAAQSSASDFTWATRYDQNGRVVGTIAPDPDGSGSLHYAAVRNSYDGAGRLIKVETGELQYWQSEIVVPSAWPNFTIFQTTDIAYDAAWRKISDKVSSGGTAYSLTQYSYDSRGRPECTAIRMNPAVYGSLPSSACTLGTQGSDGPDRITKTVYDAAGQVVQVFKGWGTAQQQAYATYGYSLNGKMTAMIDAGGNKATMTYDGFDRQVAWNFPSATTPGQVSTTDHENYTYDANGNRTSLQKRDGRIITYSYDALNRVTTKVIPDGGGLAAIYTRDVYYGYDLRGLQTYARFDNATGEGIATGYDGFGRKISETSTMGGVSRTLTSSYDADGNRTRITYPDGVYVNTYRDGLDRFYYADLNSATLLFYSPFDAQGRVQNLYRWVGSWAASSSYIYDPVSRLSALSNSPVGGGVTLNFTYNPASQITSRYRDTDAYAWNGYTTINRNYVANGLNQYASVTPSGGSALSFVHDANGNLTSDGTWTYSYDVENRLIGKTNGAQLIYDPLGRIAETSLSSAGHRRFLYDGDALAAEYDLSGSMTDRYVHGDKDDDPLVWYQGGATSSPSYLYADERGSIAAIADASGSLATINAYDEYGIPKTTNQGRFQYTGQAWIPELGMYYYKARIYSPTLGRFMQTDPIGYADQNNLYAYVANDPVNGKDPDGKQAQVLAPLLCAGPQAVACGAVMVGGTAVVACIAYCGKAVDWIVNQVSNNEESAEPKQDGGKISDRPAGSDGKRGETGGPGAGKRFKPETPEQKASKEGAECRYCGQSTTNTPGRGNSRERDHIDPKSRGGNNSPENEGDSCRGCNRSKGARNPDEWPRRDRQTSDAHYIINRYNVRFVSFG